MPNKSLFVVWLYNFRAQKMKCKILEMETDNLQLQDFKIEFSPLHVVAIRKITTFDYLKIQSNKEISIFAVLLTNIFHRKGLSELPLIITKKPDEILKDKVYEEIENYIDIITFEENQPWAEDITSFIKNYLKKI